MNNIINLSQLITRLSRITDTDPNTARHFLRVFFASIEDALAQGEAVEIKGIGTFRRCDDPAVGIPGTVAFAPSEDFAGEINRPFAVFEPVELADDLEPSDLEPEPTEEPSAIDDKPSEAEVVAAEPIAEPASATEVIAVPEAIEATVEVPMQEETHTTVPPQAEEEHKTPWEIYGKDPFIGEESYEKTPETPTEITVEIPETDIDGDPQLQETPSADFEEPEEPEIHRAKSRSWIWIAAAIIAVAGIGGYIAAVLATPMPKYGEDEDIVIEEVDDTPEATGDLTEPTPVETPATTSQNTVNPAVEPTATTPAPAATEPATSKKEPVYDTVSSTRYLAKMAREYYGRSAYWVFIYEANADKLGDPNKVAPGTRVLIPDKSELPGETDKERLAIAEKKSKEIQSKYK